MVLSKSPNIVLTFDSHVFKLYNSLICEYFLNKDFKLINTFNICYNQRAYKNLQSFNQYLLKSFSMHWARVAFRGKGFRLRRFKSHNRLTFNFGHSHWSKMALSSSEFFFKKIKRQNYMCLIKSYDQLKLFKKTIKFLKKLNVYTKRGLRLRRQFIKRRFGKISQVVSSLH